MKWQRAADGFLARFGDATSHWAPDALAELLGSVLPVAIVASDYVDDERPEFFAALDGVATVGAASYFALAAIGGDLKVERLYASSGPASDAGCGLEIVPVSGLPAAAQTLAVTGSYQVTQLGAGLRFGLDMGSDPAVQATRFRVPNSGLIELLPAGGVRLAQGRGLLVRGTTLNQALRIGAWWRNG